MTKRVESVSNNCLSIYLHVTIQFPYAYCICDCHYSSSLKMKFRQKSVDSSTESANKFLMTRMSFAPRNGNRRRHGRIIWRQSTHCEVHQCACKITELWRHILYDNILRARYFYLLLIWKAGTTISDPNWSETYLSNILKRINWGDKCTTWKWNKEKLLNNIQQAFLIETSFWTSPSRLPAYSVGVEVLSLLGHCSA